MMKLSKNPSSTKPIKNNSSIVFANENFSPRNQFLLKTKIPNLPQNISTSFPFKNNPNSAQKRFVAFLRSAEAPLEDDSRRGTRRFAPFPVLAKNEPLARFLTPEPNITALKSTSTSVTKSEGFSQTITLASTAAGTTSVFEQLINNLSASIGAGTNRSKSDSSSTTYTNTTLTANNGNLTINSLNDTNIKGANLLSQNTAINTVNNLDIESLQNSSHSKSKSSSFNAGAGGGGGGLSSISLGY